jgi:class 3 adenylate cyclase/tetratricopeptide (TPR) repeat protein
MSEAEVDRPEAYLPGDRRLALVEGRSLPEHVHGAGLFADISGFTPLTEALARELGPLRGAEELTAQLNDVFHAVIEDVHRYGGEVIYFSGDAITCWLDGDDGRRAAACGLAIQDTMARVGRVVTPSGTQVALAIKVAVAVGPARRFVVGDPGVQLIDVLAGRLVDELADAEHLAGQGDVVLAASALAALGEAVHLRATRSADDGAGSVVGVLGAVVAPVERRDATATELRLAEEQVRPWLLPAVYERLVSGRGEFLAELRPAYPVFVRFGGIDVEDDADAPAKLDEFVRRAQAVFADNGGNLLQLTMGDKGAYLYAVFGSPHAHEDDAARACAAALDLLALEGTAARDLQIGITHGRLRSGTYGHPWRRTFVCLGDAVNLSARLMSRAPAGQVYLSDEVHRAAGNRYTCRLVGDLAVKGKTEPVRVLSLVARRSGPQQRAVRYALPLVGRDAELAAFAEVRDSVLAGSGRVLALSAEAGRGKSRLVAEIVRDLRSRGLTVAFGEAPTFGRAASYAVWHEVWRTLLEISSTDDPRRQRRRLQRSLGAVSPESARRAPLLADLLGLDLPDNELTSTFDSKLRKTSLEGLLVDLLRARAAVEPLVIVLEDCHVIDPLSRDLLEELVRASADLPVLFLLAYRPLDAPAGGLGLGQLGQFLELQLGELAAEAALQVVHAKVDQLYGQGTEVAPELVDLVTQRAQGNPFYLEELVAFVHAMGVDPHDGAALRALRPPDSLHRLMLGRLDQLPEAPRSVVKVASVIGRFFDVPIVDGVYPEFGGDTEVESRLDVAGRAGLVSTDRAEDRSWVFRHVVTRDVAYDSLPFTMRTMLHRRAGEHLERAGPDAIERHLDALAYHYGNGDDVDKQREYFVRAGMAAQARYANETAAEHFRRSLPLLDGSERGAVLRRLGKVLDLVGAWAEAEATFVEAAAVFAAADDEVGVAWARTDLAEVMRKQGRFDEARRELDAARVGFDRRADEAGVGVVLHLGGTLASQQGRFDEARAGYEASLAIRERLGDRAAIGALYSNLALVALNEGRPDVAQAMNERALAVRRALGDRWAIAVSLTNLGMAQLDERDFVAARTSFAESMRLADEVGDRWLVSVGHHNLGLATLGVGDLDAAADELAAARDAYVRHDDRFSLAMLMEDAVPLAVARGRLDLAARLVGAADALREQLDAPRPPAVTAGLDRALLEHAEWWATEGIVAGERGRDEVTTILDVALQDLQTRPLPVVATRE